MKQKVFNSILERTKELSQSRSQELYGSHNKKPQDVTPFPGGLTRDLYKMPSMQNLVDHELSDEDFSDSETTPLTNDIYNGSRRSIQETKSWDIFRVLPPPVDGGSMANQKCLDVTVKVLKVFAYLFTFSVVLISGVISKGTFLLMTSQVRSKRKVEVCNHFLERDKFWEANIPDLERVAWVWGLIICFAVPEFGTWFRSTRMCVFKSWRKPRILEFLVVFVFESMHAIGLALLVMVVLPGLDVIKGAMLTNCLCFVPGVLGLLSRNKKESRRIPKAIADILAITAQATGFFIWPLVDKSDAKVWMLPLAIFLTSCGWWENYVDKRSPIGFVKVLGRIKDRLRKTRYFVYMFISLWKILVFIGVTMTSLDIFYGDQIDMFFLRFRDSFYTHKINVTEVNVSPSSFTHGLLDIPNIVKFNERVTIDSWGNTPIYVTLIQIMATWICYIFGKFACKICIQGFSFAFPVNLAIPVTLSLLISACGLRNSDICVFEHFLPNYLYWECPQKDFLHDFIANQHAWMWLAWLLSQIWLTLHIWTPKCERLASTEKLFVTPMYCGLLIDQSIAMNRKRDDEGEVKTEELELEREGGYENDISQYYETISVTESSHGSSGSKGIKSADQITRIYATATMWHETSEEMIEMLKSIYRMDEDQSARRVAQKYLKIVDPDYYEFETHIFFDDAFEIADENEDENIVNRFVKLLIDLMDEAGTHVHQTAIRIRPPKKFPAPYGGRLVWTLPGKTKIIAHLKDKSKIRHRKRWSQVMYMYYLLGHRLMELPISVDRKEVMAENTYLLTLDGDIDFQPQAVHLLVDLMKKNKNLGAACGRIHPVGSGPMVWYQMFEYAIGHWLQKATEHMIGCVLCSPGCFSLFRGKSLMDDNVMRKYTTKSDEARHYVQYDQGEDRWLCTLLLQRGYRVEYSAASDAYTHCPEGFSEFYNQRRRWVPSTMANILDLLQDYKRTIKINDNISLPYIIYQSMLMIGTILGPGTIFLMLVGAFVAAFRIGNWPSFYYNMYPIIFFMVICFVAKASIQLLVAQIMSATYALVMMAVIVGTTLQLGEDGIGSPSAIFLIALSGSFFIAACIHPQEFWCVVPGMLYLLMIPSMYLLLIIYSLINLNVVSWGTREVQTKKTKKELEQERKEAEEAKKKKKANALLGIFNSNNDDEEGSIEFSFAGLFKLMLFTHQKPVDEKQQLLRIADNLDTITKRLDHIEKSVDPTGLRKKSQSRSSVRGDGLSSVHENADDEDFSSVKSDTDSEKHDAEKRDDLINPYWIEDKGIRNGEVEYLSGPELQFWKDLISKYLYPIDANKNEQAIIAEHLKELRNRAVFFFFMCNAFFILIVFLLQLNKDNLHINWPFGVKLNVTFTEETQQPIVTKEYLQLEPIGLVFVFFFALILIIQFVAMLFHRFGTISHILASTDLNFCCNKKVDDSSEDAFIDKNAVDIARTLQKLRGIDGDYDSDSESSQHRIDRRKTIHNLEKHRQKKRPIGTLDVAFKKRFFSLTANQEGEEGTPLMNHMRNISIRQETIKALEARKNNVIGDKIEKPRMQTLGAKNDFKKNPLRHRPSSASGGAAQLERVFTPNGTGLRNAGLDVSDEEGSVQSRVKGKVRIGLPAIENVSRTGSHKLDGRSKDILPV